MPLPSVKKVLVTVATSLSIHNWRAVVLSTSGGYLVQPFDNRVS